MILALDWCCGISWSLAYIAALLIGFKNKTYCIPKLSICMNFAWELWVVISRVQSGSSLSSGFISQLMWLTLDIGILISWLAFDKDISQIKKGAMFLAVVAAVYFIAYKAGQWKLSVFVINVLMSLEFLWRCRKECGKWISPFIAFAKLVGTLAATVLNGVIFRNGVILWLGGLCLIFDSYYLMTLRRKNLDNG